MIIMSQDRTEAFNFDEIFRLYVDNWSNEEFATEPNCFCIKAEKSSDNMICAFLGEYKTEERAKEVLQEIVNLFGICKIENKSYEESDLIMKFKKQAMYKMPKA